MTVHSKGVKQRTIDREMVNIKLSLSHERYFLTVSEVYGSYFQHFILTISPNLP